MFRTVISEVSATEPAILLSSKGGFDPIWRYHTDNKTEKGTKEESSVLENVEPH